MRNYLLVQRLIILLFLLLLQPLSGTYQVSTVSLENVAYSYYMHTSVDIQIAEAYLNTSTQYSILVDTGSSFLVLINPPDANSFVQLGEDEDFTKSDCLYLMVDNTRANFTGVPDDPSVCQASRSDDAAVVQLYSSTNDTAVAAEAEVAFKLAFRSMAGKIVECDNLCFNPFCLLLFFFCSHSSSPTTTTTTTTTITLLVNSYRNPHFAS
jgi:hypothetical protein